MHDKMKKPEMSEICQIEKDLISSLKTVVSHGLFSKEVDSKELGELVDMVKDMAETKRNCWEACYYETVVKAMEKGEEEEENGEGFRGMEHMYKSMPAYWMNERMGYNRPSKMFAKNNDWDSESMMDHGRMNDRNGRDEYARNQDRYRTQYGEAYGDYEDARKHYTETKSPEDKRYMNEKAMEHVNHSMMSLREVWKNADPDVKKQVSNAIASLANEFKNM